MDYGIILYLSSLLIMGRLSTLVVITPHYEELKLRISKGVSDMMEALWLSG